MSAPERGRNLAPDPPAFAPFEVLSSTRVYDSPWVGLRRDRVRSPRDGAAYDHHVVEIPDAVAIVPVRTDGAVVLVGQYRYAHGRTQWEVPAGRIHADEHPEDAARRELAEETGHAPASLEALFGFYPIHGISAHWAHVYVAHGCAPIGEPRLDALEQLVVRAFPRGEVEALLDADKFTDGFSALALATWLRRTGSSRAGSASNASR